MISSTIQLFNNYAQSKREKAYDQFLALFDQKEIKTKDIIQLGAKLMKQARLHPHFFGNNTVEAIAHYLTFHVLKTPTNLDIAITKQQAARIIELFERRIADRIPVEYMTNEAWYLGRKFYVNENVLVPRSIMNMRFQEFLNETHWENYRVLDLCTGSGCIGITLALLNPNITVDLVDLSPKALAVARRNIELHQLQDRVNCIESDVFNNVTQKYDLIISNPPYVSTREYNATPKEFKNEPKMALECGKDGLDIIHRILKEAKSYLNPHGKLIAEIGYPAAARVKKQYSKIPFKWYKYRNPQGKEAFFGMHGVFECKASDLN
ncbi:MAG: 50S ribosomal protein L3 N(5)-glutamine methyltransferase [Candidatus Berkiella sp.]